MLLEWFQSRKKPDNYWPDGSALSLLASVKLMLPFTRLFLSCLCVLWAAKNEFEDSKLWHPDKGERTWNQLSFMFAELQEPATDNLEAAVLPVLPSSPVEIEIETPELLKKRERR